MPSMRYGTEGDSAKMRQKPSERESKQHQEDDANVDDMRREGGPDHKELTDEGTKRRGSGQCQATQQQQRGKTGRRTACPTQPVDVPCAQALDQSAAPEKHH